MLKESSALKVSSYSQDVSQHPRAGLHRGQEFSPSLVPLLLSSPVLCSGKAAAAMGITHFHPQLGGGGLVDVETVGHSDVCGWTSSVIVAKKTVSFPLMTCR